MEGLWYFQTVLPTLYKDIQELYAGNVILGDLFLRDNQIDFEKVRRLDMQFHLTIVKSAHNHLLNQTLGTLQEIMFKSMDNTLKLPGRIDASEHEHGVILYAIEKRDPIAARLMCIQHIHNARDAWFKYIKEQRY